MYVCIYVLYIYILYAWMHTHMHIYTRMYVCVVYMYMYMCNQKLTFNSLSFRLASPSNLLSSPRVLCVGVRSGVLGDTMCMAGTAYSKRALQVVFQISASVTALWKRWKMHRGSVMRCMMDQGTKPQNSSCTYLEGKRWHDQSRQAVG